MTMKYVLTLIFSCGGGCGSPAQVTLPTLYMTHQECLAAGNVWLSPNANPTRTVVNGSLTLTMADFQCDALSIETEKSPSAG